MNKKFCKSGALEGVKNQFCRIILMLVTLCFCCRGVYAQTIETGNIETTIAGIVDHIPGMGSNAFVIPTTAQIGVFENVFGQINAKNFSGIQSLLTPYNYTIIRFVHLPTSDTFYLLRESLPIKLGWGTYIYNSKTSNDLAIESPHPLWDKYTWSMGIKVFIGAKAKWFMMAGTHRYANSDTSSDMAHVTSSIFYTGHRVNANAIAVQVHGFDGSSSSYSGYPDAVISNGTLYPSTLYYTLRDNYTQLGFNVGVFSYSTYNQLNQLGATTNKEGIWSNNNNKKFVHIEHDQPLRFDTTNLRKCANAIIKTFGITTGTDSETGPAASFNLISAYPNPFNPSTTISISTVKSGNVSVSVKDILGRTVKVVHDGYLPAGSHVFRLNATTLSSGVYFGILAGVGTVKTTKLLLLK